MPPAAAVQGATVPARAARRGAPPAYALYGETARPGASLLHIESIAARSRLYNWEIDAHVHRGLHQVLWLRAGTVDARLDEARIAARGPVALTIPPGVPHAFRFSPNCEGHVFTVNAGLLAEDEPAAIGDALQTLFAAPRALALEPGSPEAAHLQSLFAALHAEHDAADSHGTPVALWLARALVWRLALLARRVSAPGRNARQPLYTRWVVLLEAHYREHWPVARYARQLGLSTERLNRMLRAETTHSARALLQARLAREACRRLVHIVAPVSQLAFELGFEDPAYFCRFFKRHTGLSPREYRRQAQRAAGA